MFKIKPSELQRLREELVDKIGINLEGELKTQLRIAGYEQATLDKVVYDKPNKLVGTTDWGIAVLDAGRIPGMPPLNRILDWVINVKERGNRLTEREYLSIAWKVANKIAVEGIEPTWFARRVLARFHL